MAIKGYSIFPNASGLEPHSLGREREREREKEREREREAERDC